MGRRSAGSSIIMARRPLGDICGWGMPHIWGSRATPPLRLPKLVGWSNRRKSWHHNVWVQRRSRAAPRSRLRCEAGAGHSAALSAAAAFGPSSGSVDDSDRDEGHWPIACECDACGGSCRHLMCPQHLRCHTGGVGCWLQSVGPPLIYRLACVFEIRAESRAMLGFVLHPLGSEGSGHPTTSQTTRPPWLCGRCFLRTLRHVNAGLFVWCCWMVGGLRGKVCRNKSGVVGDSARPSKAQVSLYIGWLLGRL